MADHKHGDMDIHAQQNTFDGFIKWVTRSVIVITLLLIWMAIFIS